MQRVYFRTMPPYDSDVREATTGIKLARPGVLWAGVGVMGGGVVLALPPGGQRATQAVDVQVAPGRVTVDRTFGF